MKLKSAKFSHLFGEDEFVFDTSQEYITSVPSYHTIQLRFTYKNGVVRLNQNTENGDQHTLYTSTLQSFIEELGIPLSDLEIVIDGLRAKNIAKATMDSILSNSIKSNNAKNNVRTNKKNK